MSANPEQALIYHITDVENLSGILAEGGLYSDAAVAEKNPTVIGYGHIKERRLKEIRVPCCGGRFVGDFVPFYFCPRSPMLYTKNQGATGRPVDCQRTILHLVSRVSVGIGLGRLWAVGDGNAGAFHTWFGSTLEAIKTLDWAAIRATDWRGKTHQKSAEFLVADFFPWTGIHSVGCHNSVVVKQVQVFDLGGLVGGPRWIINFPTKGHWRAGSRMEDIEAGLKDLVATIRRLRIRSIAIPPLGCGNGGLDWNEVRPRIEAALAEVPEVEALVYSPSGAAEAAEMPVRTERPKMTMGQAAMIALMDRYLKGLLDPFISLLEIHKLMYFLQAAGQPLRLKFEAKSFGPYATNLRQVLIRMEKHYTQGYGDGKDRPTQPIEVLPGAEKEAEKFLADDETIRARMNRVAKLIEGFEDPYGLELLSSVHWVMQQHPEASENPEMAVAAVHKWNVRKRRTLKKEHILAAWQRLRGQDGSESFATA